MKVFDKLVLVCGPSGGGKSTLLHLFHEGALPEEITRFFFPSASQWPVIDVTNKLRRQIESAGDGVVEEMSSSSGLILHYDITSVQRYGLEGYEKDPALRLLDLARDIKVLFVRPDQSILLNQFVRRDEMRRSRKSISARLWNAMLLKRIRSLRAWLLRRNVTQETQIYSDPLWVARCYSEWELYVEKLAKRTASFQGMLRVEPDVDGAGRPTFRIASQTWQAPRI